MFESRPVGRVQSGKGDASHWLSRFNAAYSRKTPTTAARDRPDPWVIELIAAIDLRDTYGLTDGSTVEVQLREESFESSGPVLTPPLS